MNTHKVVIDGVETEVVSLQEHNSTMAGVRKNTRSNFIDPESETYTANMNKLNAYEDNEWKSGIKTTNFASFKINPEYTDEVIKLTGINRDMEAKEIDKKLSEFTSVEKNGIYLKKPDTTGGELNTVTPETTTAKVVGRGGGSFWTRRSSK